MPGSGCKDLADTINAVNDKNGLRENFWEHRSFAEQGLDTIPQIHLGEKASALERAGIQTERGNVNRRIMEQNKAILTAKMLVAKAEEQLQKLVNSKPVEAVRNTANEVLDMIRAVVWQKGQTGIASNQEQIFEEDFSKTVIAGAGENGAFCCGKSD